MQIQTTIPATRAALNTLRGPGRTVALVPTMGALHAGHRSLLRAARQQADVLTVSLFVNPTQFAPNEDLSRYPRTFEADRALLEAEGVDLLFAPTPEEMYPRGVETYVDVPHLGARLDGLFRPGHFRGVATVVTKLFHILTPDLAFFGQKDAAQLAVIRALVRDLNLPVQLIACPTVREPDGLALSSRNRFLTPDERQEALALSHALNAVRQRSREPNATVDSLTQTLHHALTGIQVEYAELVHPDTLEPALDLTLGTLVAVAAHLGQTRLIDNLLLPPIGTP